ncbi:hypothetical protein KY317_00380, partial [Candidatus Woesearchaeota archaeon]|nr:hypothetical protein [Candidatus Woesearchaeota archaeon]
MKKFEKEVDEEVIKLKKDFSNIKKIKRLTAQHEDNLITNITGLLGLYRLGYDEQIRQLISQMISFGESKLWAMQGSRYLFDKLNKK